MNFKNRRKSVLRRNAPHTEIGTEENGTTSSCYLHAYSTPIREMKSKQKEKLIQKKRERDRKNSTHKSKTTTSKQASEKVHRIYRIAE